MSENETIVQAQVLDIHSYWNDERTWILTDVRVRPSRVLKRSGAAIDPGDALTLTLPGGSVDGVTVLVLGGADLVPGSEYMLFLGASDLPGASRRLTIPDLSQGAFPIEHGRVRSQAADEPLLPDVTGSDEVAGGARGLALDDFVRAVRGVTGR